MKFRNDIILHDIAGDKVALMKLDGGRTRAISFNQTSEFLWTELKGKEFGAEDISLLLEEKYGIDHESALSDAEDWIKALGNNDLLV